MACLAQNVVVPTHSLVHQLREAASQVTEVLHISHHDADQDTGARLGRLGSTLGALGLQQSQHVPRTTSSSSSTFNTHTQARCQCCFSLAGIQCARWNSKAGLQMRLSTGKVGNTGERHTHGRTHANTRKHTQMHAHTQIHTCRVRSLSQRGLVLKYCRHTIKATASTAADAIAAAMMMLLFCVLACCCSTHVMIVLVASHTGRKPCSTRCTPTEQAEQQSEAHTPLSEGRQGPGYPAAALALPTSKEWQAAACWLQLTSRHSHAWY